MERTLFGFIWKYSKRQQFVLLGVTLLTFPFLYASLELPKRIINDAIGATSDSITYFGVTFTQVQFLIVLCFLFLATVVISGVMKMHLNTMKGVLSERMLRRLRYLLIERMLRFPSPYFRTTSQGELVSMIAGEAEPMGGLMGDAVAQPAFQFGQMLTILFFLFMQSFWFGLASVALIPVQAWLIPKLQRQINLLNKERIQEIRHLSSEIGESAAGISDLRANGGSRYRLAQFTDRLGQLFYIRFKIYKKKYFMKFLNNLIGSLTPFFFYSLGGYLAIQGNITVGALVAGLAAYKDLASPWNELLTYYNQVQDMSLRWQVVTERFAPDGMIDEKLFSGEPDEIPRLDGDLVLHDVTVHDADGNPVLENISLTIPPGTRVAIKSGKPSERAAFARLLTREVLPAGGYVTLAGHPLSSLHQSVIAARIGHAHSRPYLFDGTLGENLLMPLRIRPHTFPPDSPKRDRKLQEAIRAGNSPDPLDADWIDPALAGLAAEDDIRDWWFRLVEAMGIDRDMFSRALRSRIDPRLHSELAERIVALRPEIRQRLIDKGLDDVVHHFDPERFNPGMPLLDNLLFATPLQDITRKGLAQDINFIRILREQGLDDEGLNLAQAVIDTLRQTFGHDGTDHPLFRRLGIDEDDYHRLIEIAAKRARVGDAGLSGGETALMLTVPFRLTAEQIGPSFPEKYKAEVLEIRKARADQLRQIAGDLFAPLSPDTYLPRLSMTENAIFGRISMMAGARAEEIENEVAAVLGEHGLRERAAAVIYDMPTGLGGANLPTVLQERTAFSRAGIKRPDVLVLDTVLASHDAENRVRSRDRLRELLPKATMIFLEDDFRNPDHYDMFIEIEDGRIDGVSRAEAQPLTEKVAADLRRKLKIIDNNPLFAKLSLRNQRLLAFSAQWFEARTGQVIFARGQTPDAVYLCLTGKAELHWPNAQPGDKPVSVILPGRLIGDLSIITREPRQMDLVSVEDSSFLRIGAEEFRAVIETDPAVAVQLLEVMGGHLMNAGRALHEARVHPSERVPMLPHDTIGAPVDA